MTKRLKPTESDLVREEKSETHPEKRDRAPGSKPCPLE